MAISSAADGRGACAAIAGDPAGGRLASQYLARLLDGRGEVAIINQPIVTSTLDRVTVLRDDLNLVGVASCVQQVVLGLVILLAVLLDQLRKQG